MRAEKLLSKPLRISTAAIFTALVCASTMVLSVYVPATKGYFNIGETMVYITAFLFGPSVGAFAGGVGSMLADVFLGYGYYAPGTLVIKACEGAIVGLLSRRVIGSRAGSYWKVFTVILGLLVGVTLGAVGSIYYVGEVELYLGIPPPQSPSLMLNIIPELWYGLGALVTVVVALIGFVFEPDFGWMIISIITGGLEMVFGYFLYESLVLGYGLVAIAEVPINVGQMTVGLIISIPVARVVWRYLPDLRRTL
ncbi:MAG: ECF transporter S component [Candidatus Bathyarchaeia archaeon]